MKGAFGAATAHIMGLQKMVEMSGGLQAHNQLIQRVLSW